MRPGPDVARKENGPAPGGTGPRHLRSSGDDQNATRAISWNHGPASSVSSSYSS
jgi:hypothetical protein